MLITILALIHGAIFITTLSNLATIDEKIDGYYLLVIPTYIAIIVFLHDNPYFLLYYIPILVISLAYSIRAIYARFCNLSLLLEDTECLW